VWGRQSRDASFHQLRTATSSITSCGVPQEMKMQSEKDKDNKRCMLTSSAVKNHQDLRKSSYPPCCQIE
jgi:hypothetical protein